MNNLEFFGLTDGCSRYADICQHKCCQQDSACEGDINPGNYLLIYPREMDDRGDRICSHIKIVSGNFNGGSLGFCDAKKIDQSKCDIHQNYKTLDCRSYPFAPAFINEKLVLIVDKRCPIVQEKELNRKNLDELYKKALLAWEQVIFKNEKAEKWIKSLNLSTYELYECKK